MASVAQTHWLHGFNYSRNGPRATATNSIQPERRPTTRPSGRPLHDTFARAEASASPFSAKSGRQLATEQHPPFGWPRSPFRGIPGLCRPSLL